MLVLMKENLPEEQANPSCNCCRTSNVALIQILLSSNLGMDTCRQIYPPFVPPFVRVKQ